MRVCCVGISGAMGHQIVELGQVVCGISHHQRADTPIMIRNNAAHDFPVFDVILDFSRPEALPTSIALSKARRVPLIVGTTGLGERDDMALDELSREVAVMSAANFSLGVAAMIDAVQLLQHRLAKMEVRVSEIHHIKKVDQPSGTAKTLKAALVHVDPELEELEIHSEREGNVVGEHTVSFSDAYETLSVTHTAHSKAVFAEGALQCAEWIIQQKPGRYTLHDFLK